MKITPPLPPPVEGEGYREEGHFHININDYALKSSFFAESAGLRITGSTHHPDEPFYFSVPIGNQRIEFNAHRVFSITYLLGLMEKRYDIDSFAYINDAQEFIADAVLDEASICENFGCRYGCGIFELTKL